MSTDPNPKMLYLKHLDAVVKQDAEALKRAAKNYGDSFKKRGGTGHFHMLARKWDRLETFLSSRGYDIYEAIESDQRPEGIMDDVRDLRRYLVLVEAEMMSQGVVVSALKKDTFDDIEDQPTARQLHPA